MQAHQFTLYNTNSFIPAGVQISSPMIRRTTPIVFSSQTENLTCTDINKLACSNYTVSWTRDYSTIPGENGNSLTINQSGYYCCHVRCTAQTPFQYCITALQETSGECFFFLYFLFLQSISPPPLSLSLSLRLTYNNNIIL